MDVMIEFGYSLAEKCAICIVSGLGMRGNLIVMPGFYIYIYIFKHSVMPGWVGSAIASWNWLAPNRH